MIIIILLFTPPACLPLKVQDVKPTPKVEDPAFTLFVEGVDHFDPANRSVAFLQLEKQYPSSPWNRRAKTFASLAGTIRLLEKQVNRQQTLINDRNNDQQTLISLRQENALLNEQVKVLKALIIDLELRQP